jgi:serine/threonine-protein kinase HipA
MNREIFVYIDLNNIPIRVGRLWTRYRSGRETATFEYDKSWLESSFAFSLEPALSLNVGPYHSNADKPLFGAIGDSAPDRWGRVLMRRAERMRAKQEGRSVRTLFEIDYLLGVSDEIREGALRFSESDGEPFLAKADNGHIPPFIELSKLLTAAEQIDEEDDSIESLKILLAPGSSLGGARPKASILDKGGHLAIAKFPHKLDDVNVVLWEALALMLAQESKIKVPIFRTEIVNGKTVLISRRFDRIGKTRIPFLSAMSMITANDNEQHSYLEIVDALRQQGAVPLQDIKELWRRIVFNVLISNLDDHLRNHGFLFEGQSGWRLSPAYDLNPVPLDVKNKVLTTAIDMEDNSASIELAQSVAHLFGLSQTEANEIIAEVSKVVSKWRILAKKLKISNSEIDRMASAFEVQE